MVRGEWDSSAKTEAELWLEEICGTWKDDLGSSYWLRLNDEGALDVCTTRTSGEMIETESLIQVDPRCPDNIVWGRGGPRAQYTLDWDSYDTWTLQWKRGRSKNFAWYRVDEPRKKSQSKRRSKKSSKAEWKSVDDATYAQEPAADAYASKKLLAALCAENTDSVTPLGDAAKVKVDHHATETLLSALRPDAKNAGAATISHGSAASSADVNQQWPVAPWNPVPCVDFGSLAVTLERYFCDTSLGQHSYIKGHMMPDGWVPVMCLQALPEMLQIGINGSSMIQALASSTIFELDVFACYVRIRDCRLRASGGQIAVLPPAAATASAAMQ